jgi:hypothetical protein
VSVTSVLQEVAALFVAAGVRATIDPQNVQPPCVLVAGGGGAFDHMGDCATHQVDVWLVAPGVRAADSLPQLDRLLEHARRLLPVREWSPAAVPFGDADLPAYRCSVELDRPWTV